MHIIESDLVERQIDHYEIWPVRSPAWWGRILGWFGISDFFGWGGRRVYRPTYLVAEGRIICHPADAEILRREVGMLPDLGGPAAPLFGEMPKPDFLYEPRTMPLYFGTMAWRKDRVLNMDIVA